MLYFLKNISHLFGMWDNPIPHQMKSSGSNIPSISGKMYAKCIKWNLRKNKHIKILCIQGKWFDFKEILKADQSQQHYRITCPNFGVEVGLITIYDIICTIPSAIITLLSSWSFWTSEESYLAVIYAILPFNVQIKKSGHRHQPNIRC